jgi:hypothetical protein
VGYFLNLFLEDFAMPKFVYFTFAAGLSAPLTCPKGTLAKIQQHVRETEEVLRLKTTKYLDNPPHWDHFAWREVVPELDDKVLCGAVSEHNAWVHRIYGKFAKWSATPPGGETETITPEQAQTFWHGLEELTVEPERWTADYYRERMNAMYDVLRGRETEGTTLGADPLTAEQADAVIGLVSVYLDTHDIRLSVCKGEDHLTDSDGYMWCSRCGAINSDDAIQTDDNELCPYCNNDFYE